MGDDKHLHFFLFNFQFLNITGRWQSDRIFWSVFSSSHFLNQFVFLFYYKLPFASYCAAPVVIVILFQILFYLIHMLRKEITIRLAIAWLIAFWLNHYTASFRMPNLADSILLCQIVCQIHMVLCLHPSRNVSVIGFRCSFISSMDSPNVYMVSVCCHNHSFTFYENYYFIKWCLKWTEMKKTNKVVSIKTTGQHRNNARQYFPYLFWKQNKHIFRFFFLSHSIEL